MTHRLLVCQLVLLASISESVCCVVRFSRFNFSKKLISYFHLLPVVKVQKSATCSRVAQTFLWQKMN